MEGITISKKLRVILGGVVIILISSLIFLLSVNIGLFSKYFIKKDFNNAFLARQTGNCDKFVSYLLIDKNNWIERCNKERNGEKDSIKSFSINKITINGNDSFLQVELIRDVYQEAVALALKGHDLPEGGYLVNYQMKKEGNRWFINQKMK